MVRYADKPTAEVTIDIAATPDAVWDLVTDINLPARFSNEFQGADWLDGAKPGLGARFVGRNGHDAVGKWETTCTVVWFEPLRLFGYKVNDIESPAASWRFELEPSPSGTLLTMRAEMGPGRSGVSYFIYKHPDREEEIIANRLHEWRLNMEATLAGIKSLAEADG
ncbi:MAG: SRPBCC family protein [Actinomycetota bacterium]|nr:SRPBCC family protein [Actinomycetota bacterium]